MNRERVRRAGAMAAVASFALVVLAACGGGDDQALEIEAVTRVPEMSDAAAQATSAAPSQPATPEAGAGTPPSGEATPVASGEAAVATPAASPAAATPVAGGAAATPVGAGATPVAAAPGAISVEISANDIFFAPDSVTIPANTDVTIVLPNNGLAEHNFSIDALDVSVDLAAGETTEIVINAAPGEYEFYCNVPGHREFGMTGTLIVTDDTAAATPVPATAATPAQATLAAEASPAAEAPAAAEAVEVVSRDIFFEPEAFTIPADTDVTVTLPNEGVTLHNFAIDALGIDVDIDPGATAKTTINAAAGTYEYYCNVPGHRAAGMVGTLTVE